MNNNFSKSLIAGIIGTFVMTIVMMLGAKMGLPKMSPPDMLAAMLPISLTIGWIMHFMIGVIFALSYTYLFNARVNIANTYLKGAVFGITVFIFAQIMLAILGTILPMPETQDSIVLIIVGSVVGHLFFGVAVAKTVGNCLKNKG